METGARDKHSNLPPLTWGQQTLVSDRMLNPQKKVLTPPALHYQPRMVRKASLGWGVKRGPFRTQEQREAGEVRCLSPPYQAIPSPREDEGENWE